jgi:predicted nucleic acid-binding protein
MSLTLDYQKRLEILDEKVDSIQKNLDLHITDTDKEIGDLGKLRIDVATLTETVNELKKKLDRQADKVSEVIEPLMEQIEDRKIIEYKQRSFWDFWLKKGGKK